MSGQETPDRLAVTERLTALFRAVEGPVAGLETVFEGLEAIEPQLAALPAERRAAARFWIAVRKAEIRLRQHRFDAAADIALAGREAALRAGVFAGSYYRVLALVILEQCLGEAELRPVLAQERDYLTSNAPEQDLARVPEPDYLRVPLALLRVTLAFLEGRDAQGLRDLRELATRVTADLPERDPWRIKVLGRLVWELLVRGDLHAAEAHLQQLPVEHARYPRGLLALRRGDYELARRAGRALERAGRKKHGLLLQGEACEREGDVEAATAIYRRLAEIVEDPVDRAVVWRSLGDCELLRFRRTRDTAARDAAEAHYRQALLEGRRGKHADAEIAQVLVRLGEAVEAAGDARRALEHHRAALRLVDATRRSLAADRFGRSWLTGDHLRAVDGVLRCAQPVGLDPFAVLAVLELAKARTLLDWTAGPTGPADPGLVRAVRSLALTDDPAQLDAQLTALGSHRGAAASGQVAPLDATELAHEVRRSAALVLSYWLGDDACWAVWAEGDAGGIVQLGSADTAVERLAAAFAAIAGEEREDVWEDLDRAAAFYLPPALAERAARAGRVVFCPDARLGRLPFEALRCAGEPLGMRVPVERAASLSVRARLAARPRRGAGCAVVHSVVAPDLEAELGLDPLDWSAREAALLEAAYGHGTVELSGASAGLEELAALLDGGGPFDVVHVSAHAVENPFLPTRSLLVLADGPASVVQLGTLDLGGALLVLSACSSGTGEVRGGEGELGLLGWPCLAGARGAVAAMWPVNQQATSDLMGQFHAFRALGLDDATAMMRARAVLAEAPQYAHPRYWAGFAVWSPGADRAGLGRAHLALGLLIGAALCVGFALARRTPRRRG